MATTNNLKKGINRKLWELCNLAPFTTANGVCVISSRHFAQQQLILASSSSAFIYLPEEDGYVALPNPSLTGTFGAGTCGTAGAVGPTGTATGGTGSTLNTNLTISRDLRGYKIHITSGPGAGDVREILSNTIGTNSVITVGSFSAAITAASTYRLLTPRWYVWNGGTQSAGSVKMYCYALNSWTTLSQTGYFSSTANDVRAVATPSFIDNDFVSFATGTATAGAANTLTNAGKSWTTNQWANYQIRITAGTGAGQIRLISTNTPTVITVSSNWGINPDATSQYSIEGNDDFIYLFGNNASTVYRYSISNNNYTTLTSRPASSGAGLSGHWIWGAGDTAWNNENSIINGRRIYTFRGGAGSTLEYFDIPSNSWTAVTYAPSTETYTTGVKYAYNGNFLYIMQPTGRWLRHDFVKSATDGWGHLIMPQGSAVLGDTAFDYSYKDGATTLTWIYVILNSTSTMMRCLII